MEVENAQSAALSTSEHSDSKAPTIELSRYSIQDLAYETQREVRSLIFDLKQRNFELVDISFQRLREQIDRRQVFVMFEPKLNCDPLSDHKIPKSVLPLFAAFLDSCHDQLKLDLESLIGDQVIQAFGRTYQKEIDIKYKLQSRIEQLEIELRGAQDSTVALNNIIAALKSALESEKKRFLRELQTIREQSYQKYRMGKNYQGDFQDVANLTDTNQLPNVENINYDQIRSLSAKEIRADQSKQQAQIRLLQQQCQQFKKQVDEGIKLKKDYKTLQSKYEEQVFKYTQLKRDTDQSITSLQQEVDFQKAELTRCQTLLTDREQDKQLLLIQISKIQEELADYAKMRDNFIKLSDAYSKLQDSNKSDKENCSRSEQLSKQLTEQLQIFKEEAKAKQQLYENAQKLYDNASKTIDQLREEMEKMRSQVGSVGGREDLSLKIEDISFQEKKADKKKATKNQEIQVPDSSQILPLQNGKDLQQSKGAAKQTLQSSKEVTVINQEPGFNWGPDEIENIIGQIYQNSENFRTKNKMSGLAGSNRQNSHLQMLFIKQFGQLPDSKSDNVQSYVSEHLKRNQSVIGQELFQQQLNYDKISMDNSGIQVDSQKHIELLPNLQQQRNSQLSIEETVLQKQDSVLQSGQNNHSPNNNSPDDTGVNEINRQQIISKPVQVINSQIDIIEQSIPSAPEKLNISSSSALTENKLQHSVNLPIQNYQVINSQISEQQQYFPNQQQIVQQPSNEILSQQNVMQKQFPMNQITQDSFPLIQINGSANQIALIGSSGQSSLVDSQLPPMNVIQQSQFVEHNQNTQRQHQQYVNGNQILTSGVQLSNENQQIQTLGQLPLLNQLPQTQQVNEQLQQQVIQGSLNVLDTTQQCDINNLFQDEELDNQLERLQQQQLKQQQETKLLNEQTSNYLPPNINPSSLYTTGQVNKIQGIPINVKPPSVPSSRGHYENNLQLNNGQNPVSKQSVRQQYQVPTEAQLQIQESQKQTSPNNENMDDDTNCNLMDQNNQILDVAEQLGQQVVVQFNPEIIIQQHIESEVNQQLSNQVRIVTSHLSFHNQPQDENISDDEFDKIVEQETLKQLKSSKMLQQLQTCDQLTNSDKDDYLEQLDGQNLIQSQQSSVQTEVQSNAMTTQTQLQDVVFDPQQQVIQVRESNLITMVEQMTNQPIDQQQKDQIVQLLQTNVLQLAEEQQLMQLQNNTKLSNQTSGTQSKNLSVQKQITVQREDGTKIIIHDSHQIDIANKIVKDQLVNIILKQKPIILDHSKPQSAMLIVNDKGLQHSLLNGKKLSEEQTTQLSKSLFDIDVLRKVVSIIPQLNDEEQKLLSVMYQPEFSDKLARNQLSEDELKVIGKVIYNQHITGLLTDQQVKIDMDSQNQNLFALLKQQQLDSESQTKINVVSFANNMNKCMMTKKQALLHSNLIGKLKQIGSDQFYSKLINNQLDNEMQNEIFQLLSDPDLMNRLLENDFNKETSKLLFRIYNPQIMSLLQEGKANATQCKMIVDILFEPSIIQVIFGQDASNLYTQSDSDVSKLILKRQAQIAVQKNIKKIENIIVNPEAAKQMSEGILNRGMQKALLQVFYSKDVADAIASQKFSTETAKQLSAVLYNPNVAKQLQQEKVDPMVVKQLAQTIYNPEVLKVILGFVGTADANNRGNLCSNVIDRTKYSYVNVDPQQLQPFRVKLDPEEARIQIQGNQQQQFRPRRQNLVSGIHVSNRNYIGSIPQSGIMNQNASISSSINFLDNSFNSVPTSRAAPSFIKTYTIQPREQSQPRQSRQQHFPSDDFSQGKRQRINNYRYSQKINEFSIPKGVPCCIVTLAEDDQFTDEEVSQSQVGNSIQLRRRSPPKFPVKSQYQQVQQGSSLLIQLPAGQELPTIQRKPPSSGLKLNDLDLGQTQ